MGIGAILVIVGLVVWIFGDRFLLGLVVAIVGLLLGGFRRGSWY